MRRWSFRAMGTTIRMLADASAEGASFDAAAAVIEGTFRREELRFSRFRPDSELSRVNAAAGRPTAVSPTFLAVLRLALDAAERTDGAFDPTVLGALAALGYDRDFDEVLAGARGALHPPTPCGRWTEVRVDRREVRLPAGVGLDLGGLVKGWTADLAAARAVRSGLGWVVVNAGGDLRVDGDAPTIPVAVEDPADPSVDVGRLLVRGGGVATSSTRARAWGPGLHHLIDPRTGRPAESGLVQVTATAPTCAEAEIRAKTILLAGDVATGPAAIAVAVTGAVHVGVPIEDAA
ncbi:MAG TPA: FAD:protein FMN transferase [Actinomycetota bacterium]